MNRHISYTGYVIGFGLSLILTIVAFVLAIFDALSGNQLIVTITVLAAAQLLVQLIFFLHLGKESRPRWNLLVFVFMTLILVTIVAGSLWIMKHLDYHGMSQGDMTEHMKIEADKGF